MKTLLYPIGIAIAFLLGALFEERLEWRTCRALSVFERPYQLFPSTARTIRPDPDELFRRLAAEHFVDRPNVRRSPNNSSGPRS